MTVPDYEAKFNALSRYASDLVDTDEKKCRRFKAGLETNVRTRLTSYRHESYADLVDMARQVGKDVEQMLNEREQIKRIKTELSQASRASKFGGYYRSDSKFQHQKGRNDSNNKVGRGKQPAGRVWAGEAVQVVVGLLSSVIDVVRLSMVSGIVRR